MSLRTIALFQTACPDDMPRPSAREPLALYRYAVWYKANPRRADYMRALAGELAPEAEWLDCREDAGWEAKAAEADHIILAYPDAIGLGLGRFERTVRRVKKSWTGIEVLNGRRRRFRLNGATRLGLKARRALEWSMAGELLFLPVFVVVTPVLWAIDRARGRA